MRKLGNFNKIEPETLFRFKANVKAGDDSVANIVLEYNPDIEDTARFRLRGSVSKIRLIYLGVE